EHISRPFSFWGRVRNVHGGAVGARARGLAVPSRCWLRAAGAGGAGGGGEDTMRWCRPALGMTAFALGSALGAALGSCFSTLHRDYRVRAEAEGEGADRVVVERAGIRASTGPPAEFPYVIERSGRSVERGRYQLFTRIRIENLRQDAVEVLWPEARIEVPGGEPVGLVETGAAGDSGDGEAPAAASVERVEPGGGGCWGGAGGGCGGGGVGAGCGGWGRRGAGGAAGGGGAARAGRGPAAAPPPPPRAPPPLPFSLRSLSLLYHSVAVAMIS